MAIKGPYKNGDRWMLDKDPNEKSYYAADITQELADRGTTAVSVASMDPGDTIAGVILLEGPVIQTKVVAGTTRTYVLVKLGGMDVAANAANYWTARVVCANTEEFDKTTHFNKVEN